MIIGEKNILERCLAECKHRLDTYRREGNELLVSLTEADLNNILDRLQEIYRASTHAH